MSFKIVPLIPREPNRIYFLVDKSSKGDHET